TGTQNPVSTVTGDFNGDGLVDLFIQEANSNGGELFLGTRTAGSGVLFGAAQRLSYDAGGEVVAGDFNGDGRADLTPIGHFPADVIFVPGNGDGSFLNVAANPAGIFLNLAVAPASNDIFPIGMVTADFNNDGLADVATANTASGDVSVLLNNGDGTFR